MTRFFPVLLAVATPACAPELPPASHDGCAPSAETPDEAAPFVVRSLPDAEPSALPPIVRLRVVGAEDTDAFVLIAGDVGSAHLGQLARDDVSMALSRRIVETLSYRDAHGVVLAPLARLPPGPYAVASGDPKGAVSFEVVDDGRGLDFVFPPGGGYGDALFGVWCGDASLVAPVDAASLTPSARPVDARLGLTDHGDGPGCLTLRAAAGVEAELSPLSIDAGQQTHWLAPRLLSAQAEAEPTSSPCPEGLQTVGPGCLLVEDDRLRLLPRDPFHLWVVNADGAPLGAPLAPPGWVKASSRFVRRGLAPNAPHELRVSWTDTSGRVEQASLSVVTEPPSAHLVITEVMANPVGPEPAQEWVELYNDGLAPADLSRYRLVDPAGGAALPAVVVPPGRYAVVVSEGYDPTSFYDPAPAPDTIFVTVAELATNGLSNGGEPLALERDDGRVVSRFPPLPKPKAGESVERRIADVHVTDPEGFRRTDTPSPGAAPPR